ncbi:MAG: hypothetical protein ABIQ31_15715 [Ferruginibacter sp.]
MFIIMAGPVGDLVLKLKSILAETRLEPGDAGRLAGGKIDP